MINSSLLSTEGLIKENIQYSSTSVTTLMKDDHYSRRPSVRSRTRSSSRKPRKIIHVTIRPPKNKCHPGENKSAHSTLDLRSIQSGLTSLDSQHKLNNSQTTIDSTRQTRNATHYLRTNETPRFHSLQSQSFQNSYPQKHNFGRILKTNRFPSNTNKVFTKNNSNVFGNENGTMKKKDWFSTTKDLRENSRKRKNKRCPGGLIRRCAWILCCLITAFLLSAAIAAALIATLIKSNRAATTVSTTTVTTTTISTTSTITTTSSTVSTTSSTTTTTTSPTITTSATESTTETTTTETTTTTTSTTSETSTSSTSSTSSTTTTTVQTIVTASPSSVIGSGYYGTDTVEVNCSSAIILTNITIEIFVPITNGAVFGGASGSYWVGTVNTSYITNGTYIIYIFKIASGQTITCSGAPYTFSAQFDTNGTARVTTDDTYIMTATTSSGVTNILSGQF